MVSSSAVCFARAKRWVHSDLYASGGGLHGVIAQGPCNDVSKTCACHDALPHQ